MTVTPSELVQDCLAGAVRRLIGGVHSLTSSRAVVVCADENWVRVRFSASPGVLPEPWETEDSGWVRAPRGSEPGLRDASADPVLVVVGVAESEVVAINALAIDEIGVTCAGREGLIANWLLQAQVQGASSDVASLAGAVVSDSPHATVVVADPVTGERGWVDVLAAGTAWPVRPLKVPIDDAASGGGSPTSSSPADGNPEPFPTPPSASPGAVPPAPADSGGGRIRVFGAFEVFDDHGVLLQPMQRDLIGGIFFHQPISTHDLCQLLFGSGERPASFHVAMSKMRKRGLNPMLIAGGYSIDIAADWKSFTDTAGPDPASADTDALAAAAAMISGPLFGAHPPTWTAELLPTMRAYTAAVCRELAARHVDHPAAALGYARQGLSVDPDNTELAEIIDTLTGQLSE